MHSKVKKKYKILDGKKERMKDKEKDKREKYRYILG